jgi:hypothetical protein
VSDNNTPRTTFVSGAGLWGSVLRSFTVVRDSQGHGFRMANGTIERTLPTAAVTYDHLYSVLRGADYNGSLNTVPLEVFTGADAHAYKAAQPIEDYILSSRWAGSRGYTPEMATAIAAAIATLKPARVRRTRAAKTA